MKKTIIIIQADIPDRITTARLKAYVIDAIESWSGQFNPLEDPLFGWWEDHPIIVAVQTRKR